MTTCIKILVWTGSRSGDEWWLQYTKVIWLLIMIPGSLFLYTFLHRIGVPKSNHYPHLSKPDHITTLLFDTIMSLWPTFQSLSIYARQKTIINKTQNLVSDTDMSRFSSFARSMAGYHDPAGWLSRPAGQRKRKPTAQTNAITTSGKSRQSVSRCASLASRLRQHQSRALIGI